MMRAKVGRFNARWDFFFIYGPDLPPNGLFAHLGDRQIRTYEPNPTGEPQVINIGKSTDRRERLPREGEEILFELAKSDDGRPKGSPWEYADAYDRAKIASELRAGTRKEKPLMPFLEAERMLAECHFWVLIDRAFGDSEFGWRLNRGEDSREMAQGGYSKGKYWVLLCETEVYTQTEFKARDAEQLYDRGGVTWETHSNDDGDPRRESDGDVGFLLPKDDDW